MGGTTALSAATAIGILSVAAVILVLGIAALVLFVAPRRPVNRYFALVLVLDTLTAIGGVFSLFPQIDHLWFGDFALLFILGCSLAFCAAYPIFLGYALQTPLTRPFRRRGVRIALWIAGGVGVFVPFLEPHLALSDEISHIPPWGYIRKLGPLGEGIAFLTILFFAFGFIAAVSNLRRSEPGTRARSQAKAYLVAFAFIDIGFAALNTYAGLITEYTLGNLNGFFFFETLVLLLFGIATATALLRFQLFDFDLRVKRGVQRTIVVGTFLTVFLVAFQVTALYLQQTKGYLVAGAATGLLLVGLGPIRKVAERVGDRLFPGVADEPDYIRAKKIGAYRQALEEAIAAGGPADPNASESLRALRKSLGLSDQDHQVLLATRMEAAPRTNIEIAPGRTVLGKYQVETELGAGGNGRAYLAKDLRMGRKVVLKTIPAGDDGLREARAAASLDHPNIVRVYDVEDLGAQALLVMEYVDGGSLRERLAKSGALPPRPFARLADDLLKAVHAVHEAGFVHRDIKPANILLTRQGHAKLSDFGTARAPGLETTRGTGTVGTIQYMSPEQARGRRATLRSDLYSAAATLFEAYTGAPYASARDGETATELQMRIGTGHKFPFHVQPAPYRAWFTKALAPAPEERFGSAPQMSEARPRSV